MRKAIMGVCVFFFAVEGFSSLYLYNDTPFILRAKVVGANGAQLGERTLQAQELSYLQDQIGGSDPVGTQDSPKPFNNYNNSLTPYTVFWYCKEGTLYSTCTNTAAGATVMASACPGSGYCKPPEEKKEGAEDAYKSD